MQYWLGANERTHVHAEGDGCVNLGTQVFLVEQVIKLALKRL